jgi:ParB family chromosome partitioning protein
VVGKSRVKITNSLRLLKLTPEVQALLSEGKLSEGHGKVLAGLTAKAQIQLAQKTLQQDWSVRKLEQEAKKIQQVSYTQTLERDPDIHRLEIALSEHMGCRVNIDFAERKGQLKIDFHNLEILQGLLQKMGFSEE